MQNLIDRYVLKNLPLEIAVQNENLRDQVAQTEKFKLIADLASMLAHEIKNPLTIVSSLSEQLIEKKDDPVFMSRYQKLVLDEIKRITTLLNELLQFSKPAAPEIKNINPHDVIDHVINLVEVKCQKSKISIVRDYKAKLSIPADFKQLEQAFLNLFINAIDAMEEGGTLTISTSTNYSAKSSSYQYLMTIKDTGCGIDSKDKNMIFEPFFTKKLNGSGLGLPITKGIIEKHQGRILVESQLNKGTVFNIYFNLN